MKKLLILLLALLLIVLLLISVFFLIFLLYFLQIFLLCYLRVLLDKEGGVDILDCEAISRKLSDLLDEVDPIEGSYTLEVGSAGAERALKRPGDFERFMGSPVLVKLYRPQDGSKEFAGNLTGYNAETGDVTVTVGAKELTFEKKAVALVRLRVEF